ncbi:MAG: trehalose-binding protein [Syntrophobacteraceae bacterium]|jgi:formylmethanofuran dehydrogenase subunit E|nr:trehalose-binding protein [Syntrophobacteraceae bacterium]
MKKIGDYTFDEYARMVESFHGDTAPGVILGGFMVDLAVSRISEGILFDAVCETRTCLPDAVQLLTPCTIGNGWLKIVDLGRFALSLYDKFEGSGFRVFVDPERLRERPEVQAWLYKLKPKKEQDKALLLDQLRDAGTELLGMHPVRVHSRFMKRQSRGQIVDCSLCGEPYPARDGAICRACQGESPYETMDTPAAEYTRDEPRLAAVSVEESVGRRLLHDMTQIIPGESKGPVFVRGNRVTVGDICRLQQMGRKRVYVEEGDSGGKEWVHENEAAEAFAAGMAGDGVLPSEAPREGKVDLLAARDGLFIVDSARLERFNRIPGVICASRRSYTVVGSGRTLAGTRAVPLFLSRGDFEKALNVLQDGPIFRVLPMRAARVGILVTGSEIFDGLIEDRFIPIIRAKVEQFGCKVVGTKIAPDDRDQISKNVTELLDEEADLIVTTAGLSVDPDDVTRQGLADAGATDIIHGIPVLPGAMTLLARIGSAKVLGVPACALYFKTTSFDLLLPRLLADVPVTRGDLAALGHGSFCIGCKACTFPKCPFGG